MKTRKTKRALLCALLLALVCLLAACDMRVDVYEQQDEDNWYFGIEVGLDEALDTRLNDSAAFSDRRNEKWTVGNWLSDWFTVLSENYGFSVRYDGLYNSDKEHRKTYSFTVNVPKKTVREELGDALTLQGDVTQKTNLFVRTIGVVRPNRFDNWIDEFTEVYARSDSPTLADTQTIMGSMLLGWIDVYPQYEWNPNHPDVAADPEFEYDPATGTVYKTAVPAFTTAFPAADVSAYRDVLLRNFWYASQKMSVAYDDMVYLRDGNGNIDRTGAYYVFEKRMGDGHTDVQYEYYRADPTGWYLVAIACGGAAVGIAFLAAWLIKRKKNKQPPARVEDNFPYDPFSDFFGGA